jgi:cell envelope opacity-associated protein A
LKDHHQLIYIAYQLGKVLEEEIILRTQKSLYHSQMTKHFYESSIRSYYIFEKYSIQQIFRTKNLTLTKIRRLKEKEFKFLLTDFSLEPQNLEEEY